MAIPLAPAVMARLMPMFLWLSREGRILGVGPTLAKILGEANPVDQPFDKFFQMGRAPCGPGRRELAEGLVRRGRLHLTLLSRPTTTLRGSAVEMGPGARNGVLLNLSFGIGLSEAVREFGLTEADFASSDLAMELLYLQEAKDVVLNELRALNLRLEQARLSAEAQAQTDPLTGLANRRALDTAIQEAIVALDRGGMPFAFVHLDLDRFKAVNESLGHAAGDRVLGIVADILRSETRKGDVVARVGGDEFVMLLLGVSEPGRLQELGARIIARLEEPCEIDGVACQISGSIGGVLSNSYARPNPERMHADADAALYASKRAGRGRCSVAAVE